jgi:aromatic ring-opening dioxygenase LigB subunit
MIVFGAVAPHGDPALVEGSPTRLALEGLGRRLERAAPDATVVITPHNVHVEGAFAVVVSAWVEGTLEEQALELSAHGGEPPTLRARVDGVLAARVLDELESAGVPARGVSFGSNDPAVAVMPMDWGTLIPLWFLGGRAEEPRPVVIVAPARDLPLSAHLRAGEALARACDEQRVALVASADHGHAHDPDGPFGFDPAAREYDDRVVELVRENRLADVVELEPIVAAARADSLWQLVMLHGALGMGYDIELLSYERPTYFGMLCAAFEPAS